MRAYLPFTLSTVSALLFAVPAIAHDAPSGWRYDPLCCSNRDCREIQSSAVQESAAGYLITISGETVPYGDARIKDSPDGLFHLCTVDGSDHGRAMCLYIPPRAF